MTQSSVSAFARAARTFALAAVAVGFAATPLLAQAASGKVEGRVRDQAGAPIANAQVFVVGTTYGAQTNAQGYYFINNVPASTVTIQSSFIGYKSTRVADVRVLGGQTITVDITLEATPFQVQEITVVAATNPLVPRDEVTTKQRVDGAFTDKLPVDRITNVLALQPGVVASAGGGTLSIRGGRPDEAATYVDGVPVDAGNRGTGFTTRAGNQISIGTNAFEEASITTGSASSEFGNAQSGIISIVTKSGGSQYAGSIGYETDDVFGTGTSLGFNRITGGFGGPITGNLTFHVSGVLEGQKSAGSGLDRIDIPSFVPVGVDTTVAVPSALGSPTADTTFVNVQQFAVAEGRCSQFEGSANSDIASNYGIDCQGIRNPGTASSVYQLQGKLNYTYGTGSRISLSALASQNQGRFSGSLTNPQQVFGFRNWNRVFTLNWTQNLTKSTERALAFDASFSYQTDRAIQSPLSLQSEADTRDPFGGFIISPIKFRFDFDNFPVNQELVDNFRKNTAGSRRTPYDLENTDQYRLVDNYRNNGYGLLGDSESGGPVGRLFLNKEDRLLGRGALDWQFDRYNRLKIGGEFVKYDITSYSHQLVSQAFSDVFIEEPIRYNAFIEDRLDLGDVVLVGGLRYDFYDSRASRPFTLDPNTGEMTQTVRISSSPDFDPANPTASYVRDQSHNYISPHIQVSFPVTEKTNFRLSYAHQVQAPDFGVILGGINTDLSITNTNHVYGSDLDFGRTITFEFGIRHAFNDDMVLDLSAYNRDNISNAAGRLVSLWDPQNGRYQDIRLMTNADFGNTRGIDMRLDRRFGRLFNGTVAYTFQEAKNTGSDPFTYINFGSRILNQVSGGNQPPPQAILPTNSSRPHNLAGQLSLSFPNDWQEGSAIGTILQNASVFATFRFASGTAFTRCPESGENDRILSGSPCDRVFEGDFNGARLPTFKQFDVRVTKGFALGALDVTAYLDARNIFNLENILRVFTTTNDIVNTRERNQVWSADSSAIAAEAARSGARRTNGDVDLSFGTGGCGAWVTQGGRPAAPNCVYMIRAEERWGDGDGVWTLAEQRSASESRYLDGRGKHAFTGSGRRLRLGFELNF